MTARWFQRRPRRTAFTLVEMLAAMVILIVIIGVISSIYARFRPIWAGARKMQSASDGTAVMEFMLKELSSTLCDGKDGPLALQLDSAFLSALGMPSDSIRFVSASQRAEVRSGTYYRQAQQVIYELTAMTDSASNTIPNRFQLVRYAVENMDAASYTCYKANGFPKTIPAGSRSSRQVLAENVRTVKFQISGTNGVAKSDFYSINDGRPQWIEVYLELLAEEEAIAAAAMTGAAATEYCDRRVQRFVGRAYLHANEGRK